MGMYFFLTSNSFKNVYPLNSAFDFTVDIPSLQPAKYEIALMEIAWTLSDENVELPTLCVFCDIATHNSFVKNSLLPLLRIVDEPAVFNIPYYIEMKEEYVNRIRIYMCNVNGEKLTIEPSFLRCTLHIRKQ